VLNPKPPSGSSSGADSASRRHAGPRGASLDILRNTEDCGGVRVRGGRTVRAGAVKKCRRLVEPPRGTPNDVAVPENVGARGVASAPGREGRARWVVNIARKTHPRSRRAQWRRRRRRAPSPPARRRSVFLPGKRSSASDFAPRRSHGDGAAAKSAGNEARGARSGSLRRSTRIRSAREKPEPTVRLEARSSKRGTAYRGSQITVSEAEDALFQESTATSSGDGKR